MLLRALVREALPSLDRILCAHEIDLSLITLHWFITLFAGVLHTRLLLRVWDLFFYEGAPARSRLSSLPVPLSSTRNFHATAARI